MDLINQFVMGMNIQKTIKELKLNKMKLRKDLLLI